MKIDSALKNFSEKYNEEAIMFIENLSNDFGLIKQKKTIKGFNIKEGFDDFKDFLVKYGKYKVENMDNPKASSQDVICESVKANIKDELFRDKDIRYNEIPAFIESYVSGIKDLISTADSVKKYMIESGVDLNSVGDVNTFLDNFITRLDESFNPTMDHILWASGYNSKKILYNTNQNVNKEIFL